MDDAFDLAGYLPLSFKSPKEDEYIQFLWDTFETNYTHGKYQFAFIAYHMLTMSFVYFNIWQIKQTDPEDFSKAMIGFNKDIEKEIMEATSPFTFWRVNESHVMRLLRLIGCDNGKIGTYSALVKERNETAHSNGNIFFSTQDSLDIKIAEVLRVVDEIQRHSVPMITRCYSCFLEESGDPEDREYPDDTDQIREVLIHANYFSQRDLIPCARFDVTQHRTHPNFAGIESLHETLCSNYG